MSTRRQMLTQAAAAGLAGAASGPAWAQTPSARRLHADPTPDLGPPGATGSPSERLRALVDRFGVQVLDRSPETATTFGLDRGARADAKRRLDVRSLAARSDDAARDRAQLAALRAIPRGRLAGADAVNWDTAHFTLDVQVDGDTRFPNGGGPGQPYVLSQLNGAYASVPDLLDSRHTVATREDADAYLARLAAFAEVMDQEVECVRHDAGAGVLPPDFALDATLAQLKELRAPPAASADLVQSLVRRARAAGVAGDWERPASALYTAQVQPALDRQIALLTSLRARATHDAGVWKLPDGAAFYALSLKGQTSTLLGSAEIHRLGLEQVARLGAELDRAFRGQGMTQGSPGDRLRALFADPRFLYPNTDAGKAQLIADANVKVAQVRARLPQDFGVLPKADVQIRRVPPAVELGASSNYVNGALDGSRPGTYFIELKDTAELPRWLLPTLCFHEAIPGHHLQLSIQQEMQLPFYRLTLQNNAYTEGWALYAEQLAGEMGLYDDDPFGRIGYLHDALLRAVRLVIDTGLHQERWTRERAVAYFVEQLGDPQSAAVGEVERYCVWPGQACGYMLGKLDILRLRDRWRAARGSDLRPFHDAVLTSGSMPLAVLDGVVAERMRG